MKKIIFSAAFIFILYGYAAAQNTSTKSKQVATKEEKTTLKKGLVPKKTKDSKTVLKQESVSGGKSDSVRVKLPVPRLNDSLLIKADTLGYPINKNEKK